MILILAMLLDAAFGEPKLIWDRVPHPAVLMGRLVGASTAASTGVLRQGHAGDGGASSSGLRSAG
jgi:cobalamin biosynthesis protein CobD/CbiB